MADPTLTAFWDFLNYKSLAATHGLGPTLGCTRALDTGTRFNSSGLVETVSANGGRFDHDANGVSLGLLVEEGRENKCLHNRDVTQAAWVAPNMTTAKDQVGEGGVTNSASSLLATAGNATAIQAFTIGSTAQTGTFSIKRLIGTGDVDITIDNGVTWTTVDINSLTWTRFSRTQTLANPDIGIRLVTDTDKIAVDFQGLEAGAFSTSRIATAASSVTRNGDVVSTADLGWLNSAQTFYAHIKTGNIDNDTTVWSLHDGTADNRMAVEITGGNMHFIGFDGGGAAKWDISTAVAADTEYRIAVAWAANDIAFYLNGSQVGVDGAATIPSVTTLNIGSDHANAEFLNSHFKEDRGYNVRKNNQFLEDLSNGLISVEFISLWNPGFVLR